MECSPSHNVRWEKDSHFAVRIGCRPRPVSWPRVLGNEGRMAGQKETLLVNQRTAMRPDVVLTCTSTHVHRWPFNGPETGETVLLHLSFHCRLCHWFLGPFFCSLCKANVQACSYNKEPSLLPREEKVCVREEITQVELCETNCTPDSRLRA